MWVFYGLLLLLAVGSRGIEWEAIHEFEDTFKGYREAGLNTIASIKNILVTSGAESELFLKNTLNDPLISKITMLRLSGDDKCLERFIDEDNLKFSFQIQIYQLQNPLRSRIVDIRERLSNINESIDIYKGLADSKFQSCMSGNMSCLEETNNWLESGINFLSCEIYPNCSHHSIRKRSTCSPGQFRCRSGYCISGDYFCDGQHDCFVYGDYSDEPYGCVQHCQGFRCSETFRCISGSMKCNGFNDCGDESDEEDCPPPTTTPSTTIPPTITPPTTTPSYLHVNCLRDGGDFLCDNNVCISLELTCDGHNNCGDWSDEGGHCDSQQCSPECGWKGGVCFTGPKGSQCLYECPSGTYETSRGCNLKPEAPLTTLAQVLEDTPHLLTRFAARLKFLKIKTIMTLSKSLHEIVTCKKNEFTLLSKIIDFSTIIHEEKDLSKEDPATQVAGSNFTLSDFETPHQKPKPGIELFYH